MQDLLVTLYPWTKSLHVIAVVAWMAGQFYLPRLYVYHAEAAGASGTTHDLFCTMEFKLLRVIMNPAMIATWVFGLLLVLTPGAVDWGQVWPWTKAAAVLALSGFHGFLAARRKDFASGRNELTGRQWRMLNEAPTLLLVVIVVSVIVKF